MTKHLCCQVSKECWHNTTPERIQEIVDAMKARDKEQEANLPAPGNQRQGFGDQVEGYWMTPAGGWSPARWRLLGTWQRS